MWGLKKWLQINIYKAEIDIENMITDVENMITKGKGGGENQEFGVNVYIQLYVKQVNNEHLLYSTGNSPQCFVMAYMGKESKKEWIYEYA